jgi:hypothetical protein
MVVAKVNDLECGVIVCDLSCLPSQQTLDKGFTFDVNIDVAVAHSLDSLL